MFKPADSQYEPLGAHTSRCAPTSRKRRCRRVKLLVNPNQRCPSYPAVWNRFSLRSKRLSARSPTVFICLDLGDSTHWSIPGTKRSSWHNSIPWRETFPAVKPALASYRYPLPEFRAIRHSPCPKTKSRRWDSAKSCGISANSPWAPTTAFASIPYAAHFLPN